MEITMERDVFFELGLFAIKQSGIRNTLT